MSEHEEYWIEANTPNEWSEQAIRDLVKDIVEDEVTEYHWKFVAPLEKQLEELGHKPRQANEYAFYPKLTGGKFKYDAEKRISHYHTFFTVLGMLLYLRFALEYSYALSHFSQEHTILITVVLNQCQLVFFGGLPFLT